MYTFLEVLIIYFFVSRLSYQYYKLWFYTRQGVKVLPKCMPLVGHMPTMAYMLMTKDSLEAPLLRVLDQFSYDKKKPSISCLFFSFMPTLIINDPLILEELYVTKNKYFDKHDLIKDVMKRLMGDSILLSKSTEEWSKKRKAMSPAFYKEKLAKMLDITKAIVNKSIEQIREKHVKTGIPMDLAKTISNTH